VGGVEVLTDLMLPIGSGANIAIMPHCDEFLALQGPQVPLELVEQFFIFMGIAEEDAY